MSEETLDYSEFVSGPVDIRAEEGIAYFKKMITATLIFAVLSTFLLYSNYSSAAVPVAVAVLIGYYAFSLKRLQIDWKKENYIYCAFMMLFAVSDMFTGMLLMIFFNNLAIIFMFVVMVMHTFCNDKEWNFIKYITSFFTMAFGALENIFTPITDFCLFRKASKGEKVKTGYYVFLGVMISIPLLIIIVSLLSEADAVFNDLVNSIFTFDIGISTVFGMCIQFAVFFVVGYAGFRYMKYNKISDECMNIRNFEPVIAVTVLIPVNLVYIIFSVIQVVYLFGGGALPDGYSYAEYAREGFFQLLFVCILNVIIVLIVQALFREKLILKILMTITSVCTYLMVASSLKRMLMYVSCYNLSLLRVLVLWALVTISILLIGILIQIYVEKFPLIKYSIIVIGICYAILSFARVDYHIADYNLTHTGTEEVSEDYSYLSELSTDAAPVIAKYDGEWVDQYVENISYDALFSIRKYNISKSNAYSLFKEEIDEINKYNSRFDN